MASFNQFNSLPYIPYNIISHLAQDPKADGLWKLLKYNGADALSQPSLTLKEKLALVWKGQPKQNEYSVFFTRLVEDEQLEERSLIKIYNADTLPENHLKSICSYAFDILTGAKTTVVDYEGVPCSRIDVMEMFLLQSLNGIEVSGVGVLQFNHGLSRLSRSTYGIGNNTSYIGTQLIMGVIVSDINDTKC